MKKTPVEKKKLSLGKETLRRHTRAARAQPAGGQLAPTGPIGTSPFCIPPDRF
jgi:hypothetical protein